MYLTCSFPPNFVSFQSTVENTNNKQECDVGAAKAACSPSSEKDTEFKASFISKEESFRDSCDTDEPCADNTLESVDECKDTKQSKVKLSIAYPEPRLPFPCMSSLSSKDQIIYLGFLMSKKNKKPPQVPPFSP